MALYESVLGLLQIVGLLHNGHTNFILTGSFNNPGPYGGLLAILLSILCAHMMQNRSGRNWYEKGPLILSSISCGLCVMILPITMSRAAWLAFGVALIVYGIKEKNLIDWVKTHKMVATIATTMIIMVMTGAFYLKKESAIGRFHIWHMELRAISKEPLRGHGRGSVLWVYGDTQADYFSEKERPEIIKKVAGCPEYAFNEYLKIGVEYGIPALLTVVAVLFFLIALTLRIYPPFAYGLITLSVFAFFSYPLDAFHIKSDAEREWERSKYLSSMELYEDAIEKLSPLYGDLKDNYRYIYDYGYALYKCNLHKESIEILEQGATISSDPMFYNIMGRNYEAMGSYKEAEEAYLHAHYMVPHRLYPLTLLMRMNIRLGNDNEALRYGKMILDKPVNKRHKTMLQLQADAKHCVDSLISINKYL